MSGISPDRRLLIGKVIRPHGLRGLLRIISYAQSEASFLESGVVYIQTPSGETREYGVVAVKPHKNAFLLQVEGVTSEEQAEECRGADIFIGKDTLKPEEDEGYFWCELIGLEVYLNTGQHIGTLKHILPTGSNDIYVVRKDKKEILIPAIHDVVKEVDLLNRKMIILEIEGLLDLNEV